MSYNTGERKDIRRAEKAAKLAEQNRGEVLLAIMSTIPGREWIWNRLSMAGVFTVFPPTNALAMAFNEGNRNQGLALLNDVMQWCPDEFILAMREANARRTDDDARGSASAEHRGSENGDGRDQGSADSGDDDGDEAYRHPSEA